MFCRSCGQMLADGAKFCTACGNPVAAEPAAPEQVVQAQVETPVPQTEPAFQPTPPSTFEPAVSEPEVQPAFVPPVQPAYEASAPQANFTPAPKAPLHANPSIAALKKALSSPLMLVATILYSIMVLCQLLGILGQSNDLNELLYQMGGYEAASVLNIFTSISQVVSLLSMTPVFLILIGLWISFAQSRKKNEAATTGLTFIKSATIVRLVGQFLVLAIYLVFMIFIISQTNSLFDQLSYDNSYYYSDPSVSFNPTGILVGIMIAVLAIVAIPIAYEFCILASIGSMKKTLLLGVPQKSGFGATIVFNYITVGISALSLLTMLGASSLIQSIFSAAASELSYYEAQSIQQVLSLYSLPAGTIIAQICMIAVLVLFSVNLSKYKKSMA